MDKKSEIRNPKSEISLRGGFTLTEMLLVVVIIALVGGVGGGIYVGTHKRMLVEKAARDFLLTAQYARIMAIEQGSRYMLRIGAVREPPLHAAPVSSVEDRNGGFWLETLQWDEEARSSTQVIVQDYYCRPVEFTGDVKFEDVRIVPVGLETAEGRGGSRTARTGDTIVFSPSGTAYAAVVQIGDGKTHYAISIDAATGKTTMYFGLAEKIKASSVDLDAE
jgi:prepilin-type N-terminal cleavage/methylation domain-containing protein